MFWPCPTLDHPGTPRPFEGGRFYHPDGKARFHAVEWRPPAEPPDQEFPLRLTTGRTVAHFLSGNQTRRLPGLVEQTPRPWVEVHPSLGFADGDPVRVVTRRGAVTYPALVTEAIRADTVFVPYHWAGPIAANVLTIDALDPISKMPEFKVCACRVERGQAVDPVPGAAHAARAAALPARDRAARRPAPTHLAPGKGDRRDMMGTHAVHRPGPLHRLPGVRGRLPRMRLAPGQVDDPPGLHRRRPLGRGHAHGLHALRGPGSPVRRGLPGRRHPGHRRRRGPGGGQGALHRLRQLRRRLPVRGAQAGCGRDAPVQVQPLL